MYDSCPALNYKWTVDLNREEVFEANTLRQGLRILRMFCLVVNGMITK